jgi:hypothetical protein
MGARSSAPQTWDYNGFFGGNRTIRLTPGELDSAARDVFRRGHCHSLALALYELLPDAELMGVWNGGELEHVLVALPDGGLLDANGLTYDDQEILRHGLGDAFIGLLDYDELESAQERSHFRQARTEDAMPFARALIEREQISEMALAA